MEMKINIKRCFYELWKKKKVIALIVVLSILIGLYMMLNVEEVGNYSASSSVYYSTGYGNYSSEDNSTGTSESGLSEFSEIVYSTNVAKRAAALLDRDGVTEENIIYLYSSEVSGNFLYITSYANDKSLAVGVANAVAEAFTVEYKNLTGAENIQVFEQAEDANYYKGDDTNKKMTLIIFTGVGLFFICVILVFRVIFSAKIQDYGECSMDGVIEILGVIPEIEE